MLAKRSLLAKYSDLHIFLFLLLLAIIMRFFSFFPSLLDHDESTYLVIAKEILKGKVLYADITDIKGVGIFYLAAAYLKIFGDSILGFRIFGAIGIALTSFLIYRTKLKIGHPKCVALASGVIYQFFLSVWRSYGVAVNTEHFLGIFTSLAVFILFASGKKRRIPIAGFVFGLGFLIKFTAVFDFISLFLFLIILSIAAKKLNASMIRLYGISAILFFTPFLLVNLAFYLSGHFHDFYQINYIAFVNYPQLMPPAEYFSWLFRFFIGFFPILIMFLWALLARPRLTGVLIKEKWLAVIWIIFCLIAVTMPGRSLNHYFIQLMLPISFLAGNIFHPEFIKPKMIKYLLSPKMISLLLFILVAGNVLLQKERYYKKMDCPREIAAYLKKNMERGDIVYTGNAHQIIYFLLDLSPPTQFVHSSLLFNERHIKTLNIDPEIEFDLILKSEPKYVLERGVSKKKPSKLQNKIRNDYILVERFAACDVGVYRRNAKDSD